MYVTHEVVTVHWVVSYSKVPLAVYFTFGNVHVSMLPSQFVPPFPSPTASISLFSMSVSLSLSCNRFISTTFSSFRIYALIYDICFSLSDLLHLSTEDFDGSETT